MAGEVVRDHDGCVVAAGAHALEGLVLVGEAPADLGVLLEGVDHEVAGADAAGALERDRLVLVDNGDRDVARVLVGVPVGEHIDPCVQARDDGDADHHDQRDRAAEDPAQVATKYFKCLLQGFTPKNRLLPHLSSPRGRPPASLRPGTQAPRPRAIDNREPKARMPFLSDSLSYIFARDVRLRRNKIAIATLPRAQLALRVRAPRWVCAKTR